MKKYISSSVRLTLVMLVICCVIYFGIVAIIGRFTPGKGGGRKIEVSGRVVGYEQLGQKFTSDKYFWGRPSAVDYNAAGSGGSNKGPGNTDYLHLVEERINRFLESNPGVRRAEIPAEMVTASGSGLDPHLSPASALIQVKRIAQVRQISEDKLTHLIAEHIEHPLFGPQLVHVLKLNIALDTLQ